LGQYAYDVYPIDEEATKNAVEKYLRQAREYQVTEYIPVEPKYISVYSEIPGSYTGRISDPTANIAAMNIDEPERRRKQVERAEKAISRLGTVQQRLIRMRYMDDDNVMDIDVAAELGYGDRHYRRIKSFAVYRLATILGLVVLHE